MAKRPRISCYCQDEQEKDRISSRLEDIRRLLPVNSTTRDVLLYLLEFYEDNFGGFRVAQPDQSRQIMVANADTENQLFICEQQQLELLVVESGTACINCRAISWKVQGSTMTGHVLCTNLVCSNCNHVRRWLSSSIISDRYTVNAR